MTSKKVVKAKAKNKKELPGAALTAAEIRKFQQIIADVGSRKSRGFIYMAKVSDNETMSDKENPNAVGVVFLNRMSARLVIANLINHLNISPLELLMMASGDPTKHVHDENCL